MTRAFIAAALLITAALAVITIYAVIAGMVDGAYNTGVEDGAAWGMKIAGDMLACGQDAACVQQTVNEAPAMPSR